MIKRIKEYLRQRRLRKRIQKEMQIEVLETLGTICLYLEAEGHYGHNPRARYMGMHFKQLKQYSEILREEIKKEAERCKYVY